jgi:rubrerythrin
MTKLFYTQGCISALVKLGLDSAVPELIDQLHAAVDDEAKGHEEYLDMADQASKAEKATVQSMALSHAADEARHRKEDSNALAMVQ